jgi:hypothetical protein
MTKFNVPPKGGGAPACAQLNQKFTQGLLACFERTGQKAIDTLATDNPTQFLRFVSGVTPDGQGAGPLMDISDDELAAILAAIRQTLDARAGTDPRADAPQGAEPAAALPALHAPEAVP